MKSAGTSAATVVVDTAGDPVELRPEQMDAQVFMSDVESEGLSLLGREMSFADLLESENPNSMDADDQRDILAFTDHVMESLRNTEAKLADDKGTMERRLDMIRSWFQSEELKLLERAAALRARLAQVFPLLNLRGKKSIELPNGKLGTRASKDSVTITDPEKALAWAKENAVPYKTTEAVRKTELIAYMKATGETEGDGWEMAPGSDVFYAKPLP